MTIQRLMNQPLTIQRVSYSDKDKYGNSVAGPLGSPVAAKGYLTQETSMEYIDGRSTAVSKWVAYLWAATVIGRLDYINFQTQVFQVDGEPEHVYNPRTKTVSHLLCKLVVVS